MLHSYLFWSFLAALVAAAACGAYGLPLVVTLVIAILTGEFVILVTAVEDALRLRKRRDHDSD